MNSVSPRKHSLSMADKLDVTDILFATQTVENIHKRNLDALKHFISSNKSSVIKSFHRISINDGIDQQYKLIREAFSPDPDFDEHIPYLFEIVALTR